MTYGNIQSSWTLRDYLSNIKYSSFHFAKTLSTTCLLPQEYQLYLNMLTGRRLTQLENWSKSYLVLMTNFHNTKNWRQINTSFFTFLTIRILNNLSQKILDVIKYKTMIYTCQNLSHPTRDRLKKEDVLSFINFGFLHFLRLLWAYLPQNSSAANSKFWVSTRFEVPGIPHATCSYTFTSAVATNDSRHAGSQSTFVMGANTASENVSNGALVFNCTLEKKAIS